MLFRPWATRILVRLPESGFVVEHGAFDAARKQVAHDEADKRIGALTRTTKELLKGRWRR
jgi:hypothetical protein